MRVQKFHRGVCVRERASKKSERVVVFWKDLPRVEGGKGGVFFG